MPRHGNTAVNRNRLKRRLREIIRSDLLPTNMALDIIVKTAPTAYAAPFDALRAEMHGVIARLVR